MEIKDDGTVIVTYSDIRKRLIEHCEKKGAHGFAFMLGQGSAKRLEHGCNPPRAQLTQEAE